MVTKPLTEMTREEIKRAATATLQVVIAVGEVVREVGRAPKGAVYLALSEQGFGLTGFDRIVKTLVTAGVVKEDGDELVWAGPTPDPKPVYADGYSTSERN